MVLDLKPIKSFNPNYKALKILLEYQKLEFLDIFVPTYNVGKFQSIWKSHGNHVTRIKCKESRLLN